MIARAFLVYSAWGASASAKEPSMAHLVKALQDLRQRRGLTTGQFVYTLFLEMHFQPAVFVRPLAAKNSRGTKKWMLSGRCIKCKRKSTVDDMELLRYSHFQALSLLMSLRLFRAKTQAWTWTNETRSGNGFNETWCAGYGLLLGFSASWCITSAWLSGATGPVEFLFTVCFTLVGFLLRDGLL